MAAEIAVAAVIRKAIDIAANLLVEEGSRLYWLREDIDWIQREMRRIQSYLADADSKRERDGNQGITNFINDIRDLAYDIEDIMDEFSPWMTRRNRKGGFMGFLLKTATYIFYDGYTAHCLAMEIQKIKRRVEDINTAKNTFGITESSGGSSSTTDTSWDARRTFSHIVEPNIVGFEQHIEELKAKLSNKNFQHSVISIVGMPGLGKTTLARKVYNSVKSDFHCSAWICVSQNPNIQNLLQEVARQVGLGQLEQDLEVKLYEFLSEKRYVIVVDDIWHQDAWEALIKGIPTHSKNGSRIIITSRLNDVGRYIGGESSLHVLHPLSEVDSWKLFSKLVSRESQSTDVTSLSTELEDLGRLILERCGGVPLAIVVTAGVLLSRQKTESQWRAVLESMGQREDECSKILALSYKDLPVELKPCFLYFGIFPEDREISAFQLINIWVAERFVEASGVQLLEDVGEDYLNQLIGRNLIQAVRSRHDGRIKSCRIHDLLHNLCILEAVKSNFFNTSGNVSNSYGTRVQRVSIQGSSIKELISLKNQTTKLRALLCLDGGEFLERNQLKKSFLGHFRFLRVLTVEFGWWHSPLRLPNEIGSLSYLSYFEVINDGQHVELPSTMGNLKKLLTLNVELCPSIYFPTFIWKMKQLRHVLLPRSCQVRQRRSITGLIIRSHKIEEEEVSLLNLQTLSNVPGECIEPGRLRKLPNIRKLVIVDSRGQDIQVLSDAVSEKLEDLRLQEVSILSQWKLNYLNRSGLNLSRLHLSGYQNLHKLSLKGFRNGILPKPDKLPPNLTKLVLRCCDSKEDPLEHLKNLPKLKYLKLGFRTYNGEKMMCSSGGTDAFPQLQVLYLCQLHYLKEIYVEEGGMPKLKELRVRNCPELTEMPNLLRDIMIHY